MNRPSILALAALTMLLALAGCGDDDSSSDTPGATRECLKEPPGVVPSDDAGAARTVAIDYFLTCDPAACTEHATPNHVEADYGTLARCEQVRKSNLLTRKDIAVASRAQVDGTDARLTGRVRSTGQTFVVELKKIAGSWKVDRIRGSQ